MKVDVIDKKTGRTKTMDQRFAKVLVHVGRATYATRDMIAAPEVDSAGVAWDEGLHVRTRLKNADGTWRKRPAAKSTDE